MLEIDNTMFVTEQGGFGDTLKMLVIISAILVISSIQHA